MYCSLSKKLTQTQKTKTTERSTGLTSRFPITETQKTENQMPKVTAQHKSVRNFIGRTYMVYAHTWAIPPALLGTNLWLSDSVFSEVHFDKTWVQKQRDIIC